MAKGFSVLGDSISTLAGHMPDGWRIFYEGEAHVEGVTQPGDTWWGKVIHHFGGTLVSNASYSGCVVEGFGFPAGTSDRHLRAVLGPDGQVPDVVLVYMGLNDYGWGGGRNQVMGQSISASAKPDDLPGPKEVEGVVGPEALTRFEEAYELMLQKVHQLAPKAEIWCVTMAAGSVPNTSWPNFIYRIRGIEFEDYNQAIRNAAARAKAQVADVASFGVCYDSVDGAHPTAHGMEQVAAMVICQMEGKGSDPAALPQLADAAKPQRECFEDNCHGCPHADIQKERWSLYCDKFEPRPE